MTSELQTLFDPQTCTRKGLCPVTDIRNKGDPLESHSLYFEQHGFGPEKIIFIMGLNSSSFAWLPQVKHFSRIPKYTVLVFDNRGVGNSTTPKGPYTTTGMAEDAIALLNYLGFTEPRSIHVVGLSLGGMISQELAYRIPERMISLTLGVTTAGGHIWNNLPPWKGFKALLRMTFMKDPAQKIPILLDLLYTSPWIDEKAVDDPRGRTNREVEFESYARRFQTTRPQTLIGALSQMSSGLTHHVSAERLRQISKSIPKVTLATGDQDNLVSPDNTIYLKTHMKEAEVVTFENTGHAIHYQRPREFNAMLERVFEEGRENLHDL
ncbi:Alpha/Beta hydrolase protein [Lentinula edodes]|uniref:Alpha/Beta hydrolase protein n=1 Tax=Lentinula edodes TaxID=5353 RepID=UPI001E8EE7AB|nr:Alpha/Beta hydrolase protein [Lentinula edodes]KAH7877887.1 Alpha/Beta hydrolase protein [Lentinula edodes]